MKRTRPKPPAFSDCSAFQRPASPEQLADIRKLGGHPPDYLSYNQANVALRVLRSRQRNA